MVADGVPGDLIVTGVWRGGATIFMRAMLKAQGVDEVRANLAAYGMLDEQVRFLKGWFKDTLPGAGDRRDAGAGGFEVLLLATPELSGDSC